MTNRPPILEQCAFFLRPALWAVIAPALMAVAVESADDGPSSVRAQQPATSPDGRESQRRVQELHRTCKEHFSNGELAEEVAAREELVSLYRSLAGEKSWRTKSEEQLLQDALRASAADEEGRKHIRESRRHYLTGTQLLDLRQFDAAERAFSDALAAAQPVLGQQSGFVAELSKKIGTSRVLDARFEPALEILEPTLTLMTRLYGEDHPFVSETLANLADAYLGLKRPKEATAAAERAFLINRSAADDAVSRASGYFNLARFYNRCGKFDEAERTAAAGAAFSRSTGRDAADHVHFLLRREIAKSHFGQERRADAKAVYVALLAEIDKHPRSTRFAPLVRELRAELDGMGSSAGVEPDDGGSVAGAGPE